MEIAFGSGSKPFNIQVMHVLSGEEIGVLIAAEGDHLVHKAFREEWSGEMKLPGWIAFKGGDIIESVEDNATDDENQCQIHFLFIV